MEYASHFPSKFGIGNKGSQRLARPSRDIGLVWFWVVRFFLVVFLVGVVFGRNRLARLFSK